MAANHPVTILRRELLRRGWQPVAVVTNQKNPISKAWPALRGLPSLSYSALNTGINCAELRAIDIDIDDPDLARTATAIALEIFGDTPLIRYRADSARRLLVYRGVGKKKVVGRKKDSKNYHWKVEVLSEGQQFVAFGGHPNGSEWQWEGATPETFNFADAPEVTEEKIEHYRLAIVDALHADPLEQEWSPPVVENPVDTSTLTPRLRAYAEVTLEGERRRVAEENQGNRNNALNTATMKLAQLVAIGLLDQATIQSVMEQAAVDCGYVRDKGLRATRASIASGMSKGLREPRRIEDIDADAGSEVEVFESISNMIANAEAKRVEVSEDRKDEAPAIVARLDDHGDWTRPEGLLGHIADWIEDTSSIPNRPLAVAAAVSTLSVICGRWLYGPTNSAVNIYVAMLGQTGIGKDRPLSAPGEILHACELGRLAKSGKAFSVSALEQIIVDTPVCLAAVDEMGTNLLARIMHKRASPQESAMKGTLQELWSRTLGKGPFLTTARASAQSIEVQDPALTLFGASTPDQFYENLNDGQVLNGFMNRFLIAPAAPRSKRNHDMIPTPCPQFIIEAIERLKPKPTGNMPVDPYSGLGKVVKTSIPWANDAAKQASIAWQDSCDELVATPRKGELWGRAFEYAVRLATLHAISRGGERTVEVADLEWGISWVKASVLAMQDAAENLMFGSEYEGKLNKVKEAIRKAHSVRRSELLRQLQYIEARELTRIADHLKEADTILIGTPDDEKKKHGRNAIYYTWIV